jgi:hypothetical protein
MTGTSTTAPSEAKRDRLEIVVTVLLALAAVATAWSSYQANRWNGEQAKQSGHTNALRIDAARAQGLAQDETQVDVATFIQWVDAYASGDVTLQDFYTQRFRDEFKPAFDAWIAGDPFENPDAAPTPFKLPQYQVAAKAEAERLDAAAAASSELRDEYIQRSGNYVLAVVLFAAVLFFAGISTKLKSPGLRTALVVMGCVLFVLALTWVATFPVTMSI